MAQQTKGSAVLFIGLLFAAAAAAAQAESVEMIYSIDGGLAPGWRDVSWNGMYDIHYRADMMMGGEGMQQQQQQNIVQQPLREEKSGTPSDFPSPYGEDMAYYEDSTAYGVPDTMRAIYASPSAYGGLSLHAPMPLNASSVSFYINIVPGGDPSALLLRLDTDKNGFRAQAGLPLSADAATGVWQLVVMPLSKLGSEPWDRISIQDISGAGSTFFVTDLCLDVGPEAQSFSPFNTYLPPVWPMASEYSFRPGQDLFMYTDAPMTLYQNGIFAEGVSTWSWNGLFDYLAPSPTGAHMVTRAELGEGGGLSFTTEGSFEGMDTIVFWIFQESYMALNVRLEASASMNLQVYEAPLHVFAPDLVPGVWTMVVMPVPHLEGMRWDRFSLVEHGFDAGKVIYVDSLVVYPRHEPAVTWGRVFPEMPETGDVPLYVDHLMPGVADYSWEVNHDTEFDLPDGHRCIRATAEPFGAVSLKTQSPFSGMAALEFSLWLTVPTSSQYVPETRAFGMNESFPAVADDLNQWSASIAIRFDASVPQADRAASGGMYDVFPLSEIAMIEGGQWERISVPLADFDPEHAWDRVSFMDTTGMGISFFLDDIVLKAMQ